LTVPRGRVPIWQVDAFTNEPFRGNPAAVCLLEEPAAPEWMQGLAAEMNLSETAYLVPRDGGFDLRWFTPTVEVDLCGHATLASAHVLLEQARVAPGADIAFHTRSGVLSARGQAGRVELDFPSYDVALVEIPEGLEAALGARALNVARSEINFLVELDDAPTVRDLRPDIAALREVEVDVVCVTARSDDDRYDFVSRSFGPRFGIDEDPVTGSAHCVLAPWWSGRLGRTELTGYQASARGGVVHTRLMGGDRVALIGDAVTVWAGELTT
jgi:PhzF family phenazine biosynthesis protein